MNKRVKVPHLNQYKYLTFIAMFFITLFTICDTTIYRAVLLFGKELPLSGFVIPFLFQTGDIISEVYGYDNLKKVAISGLICQVLFGSIIAIALMAPSPDGNTTNYHYSITFQHIFRTVICSVFSVGSGIFLSGFLIQYFKLYTRTQRFVIRILISSGITESILCTVAYTLLFYAMKSPSEILKTIFFVWVYKMCFAIIISFFTSRIAKMLKKLEAQHVNKLYQNESFRSNQQKNSSVFQAKNDSPTIVALLNTKNCMNDLLLEKIHVDT